MEVLIDLGFSLKVPVVVLFSINFGSSEVAIGHSFFVLANCVVLFLLAFSSRFHCVSFQPRSLSPLRLLTQTCLRYSYMICSLASCNLESLAALC